MFASQTFIKYTFKGLIVCSDSHFIVSFSWINERADLLISIALYILANKVEPIDAAAGALIHACAAVCIQ